MSTTLTAVSANQVGAIYERLKEHLRTLPGQLIASMSAISLAVLLLFLSIHAGVKTRDVTAETIIHDTAPSIVLADQIAVSLSNMDSDLANELLVPIGGDRNASDGYAQASQDVVDQIGDAMENISNGDAERKPLNALLDGVRDYEGYASIARALHSRNDAAELMYFRRAHKLMTEKLLPAAHEVDRVNRAQMDEAYKETHGAFIRTLGYTYATGLLLALLLVLVQLFLNKRFLARFNIPLVLATGLAVFLAIHTVSVFHLEASYMFDAQENAFNSIHSLWQARAIAAEAKGAESFALLDTAFTDKHRADFLEKSARIANLNGHTYQELDGQIDDKKVPNWFSGFLHDEIANITYGAEERDPAQEMVLDYGAFLDVDAKIRALESAGDRNGAIKLSVGTDPGQANYAFAQFEDALMDTVNVNDKHFQSASQKALGTLEGHKGLYNEIACLLIAVLSIFGLWLRLKEFPF